MTTEEKQQLRAYLVRENVEFFNRLLDEMDKAFEIPKAPDPGEGWRLLQAGEIITEGDEYFDAAHDEWRPYKAAIGDKFDESIARRRIAPTARCPLGHEGELLKLDGGKYSAHCKNTFAHWIGPVCNTAEEAIKSWDDVMGALAK